jgi:hypothetical protein
MTKEDGFTYLCTGALLNDSLSSNTPYLFSASHCIDSAMAARTLNTFWFFDAVACGSDGPRVVQQTSGAVLLARSADWDWAVVRLNAAPPVGTHFSAWRAEPSSATRISTRQARPNAGPLRPIPSSFPAGRSRRRARSTSRCPMSRRAHPRPGRCRYGDFRADAIAPRSWL